MALGMWHTCFTTPRASNRTAKSRGTRFSFLYFFHSVLVCGELAKKERKGDDGNEGSVGPLEGQKNKIGSKNRRPVEAKCAVGGD